MPLDTKTLFYALGLDTAVALVLLLLFSFLRAYSFAARFYSPNRYKWSPKRATFNASEGASSTHDKPTSTAAAEPAPTAGPHPDEWLLLQRPRPPQIKAGLLSWLPSVIQLSEAEVLKHAGLDVAVYLRALQMGLCITLLLSVWCCAVVVPVNLTGHALDDLLKRYPSQDQAGSKLVFGPGALGSTAVNMSRRLIEEQLPVPDPSQPGAYVFSDLDKMALSNVKAGSQRLWVHLGSMYLITAVVLTVLWRQSRQISALHVAHAAGLFNSTNKKDTSGQAAHRGVTYPSASHMRSVVSRTVLVTEIPGTPTGTFTSAAHHYIWNTSVLRFMPRSWKVKLERTAVWALDGTATNLAYAMSLLKSKSKLKQRPEGPHNEPANVEDAAGTAAGSHDETVVARGSQPAGMPSSLTAPLLSPPAAQSSCGDVESQTGSVQFFPDPLPDALASSQMRAVKMLGDGMRFPEMVWREMCWVYGQDEVVGMIVLPQLAHLRGPTQAYQAARLRLENLLDSYAVQLAKGRVPVPIKVRVTPPLVGTWAVDAYGLAPVHLDALDFQLALVNELKAKLDTARDAGAPPTLHAPPPPGKAAGSSAGTSVTPASLAGSADDLAGNTSAAAGASEASWQEAAGSYLPTALVTFRSRFTATVAASGPHAREGDTWCIRPAPEPADILWPALGNRMWLRQVKRRVMWGLFSLVVLLYVIPVSALQGLLQVQRLETVPVLSSLLRISIVRSLISGILPGLVLRLLILVMPLLLRALVTRSGTEISTSQVDSQVMSMFFVFQVATVFLSSFVAGTLLNQLTQFIESPPSVLTVLGTGAPQVASFFILYIIFNALVAKPLAQLRLLGLLVYSIRYRLAATPRARQWLWARQEMPLGALLPDHTMTLLLALVFCCVNPLVAPAAAIYFALVLVLERYQQVYVWRRRHEGAGRMWRQVFVQCLAGLYFSQITLLGLLGIKRFKYTPLLLLPVIATVWFHRSARTAFPELPWGMLSLRDARDLDFKQKAGDEAPPTRGTPSDGGQAMPSSSGKQEEATQVAPAPLPAPAPNRGWFGLFSAMVSSVSRTNLPDEDRRADQRPEQQGRLPGQLPVSWGETPLYYKAPELVVAADHEVLVAEVAALQHKLQTQSAFLAPSPPGARGADAEQGQAPQVAAALPAVDVVDDEEGGSSSESVADDEP